MIPENAIIIVVSTSERIRAIEANKHLFFRDHPHIMMFENIVSSVAGIRSLSDEQRANIGVIVYGAYTAMGKVEDCDLLLEELLESKGDILGEDVPSWYKRTLATSGGNWGDKPVPNLVVLGDGAAQVDYISRTDEFAGVVNMAEIGREVIVMRAVESAAKERFMPLLFRTSQQKEGGLVTAPTWHRF